MPFEFIQIPANGQGAAKETLNALLRGGRIASVRKEFVANAEDSFWAFWVSFLFCPRLGLGFPGGAVPGSRGPNWRVSCRAGRVSAHARDAKAAGVPGAGRAAEAALKAPGTPRVSGATHGKPSSDATSLHSSPIPRP